MIYRDSLVLYSRRAIETIYKIRLHLITSTGIVDAWMFTIRKHQMRMANPPTGLYLNRKEHCGRKSTG